MHSKRPTPGHLRLRALLLGWRCCSTDKYTKSASCLRERSTTEECFAFVQTQTAAQHNCLDGSPSICGADVRR